MLSPLAAEIYSDLKSTYPSGAGARELSAFLGNPRASVDAALTELLWAELIFRNGNRYCRMDAAVIPLTVRCRSEILRRADAGEKRRDIAKALEIHPSVVSRIAPGRRSVRYTAEQLAERRRQAAERQEHARTHAHLVARYGFERAASIMAGQDAEANTDIAAWRSIGTSDQ